jgi:hypothetical protein
VPVVKSIVIDYEVLLEEPEDPKLRIGTNGEISLRALICR